MTEDRENGMTAPILVMCIVIIILAATVAAHVVTFYFPPENRIPGLYTSTTPSIPLPDNFVSPQIQCTGDGIIAFVPGYILNKTYTYTIEFAENTSTNHPEGLWVLRMRNGENENILVRCV